jgi:hypothetical protein
LKAGSVISELFGHLGVTIEGKNATVVGRGDLVVRLKMDGWHTSAGTDISPYF